MKGNIMVGFIEMLEEKRHRDKLRRSMGPEFHCERFDMLDDCLESYIYSGESESSCISYSVCSGRMRDYSTYVSKRVCIDHWSDERAECSWNILITIDKIGTAKRKSQKRSLRNHLRNLKDEMRKIEKREKRYGVVNSALENYKKYMK